MLVYTIAELVSLIIFGVSIIVMVCCWLALKAIEAYERHTERKEKPKLGDK